MKEYKEPVVEVIELPKDDVIATSGGPYTEGDTHLNPGSILRTFGTFGKNGLPFD